MEGDNWRFERQAIVYHRRCNMFTILSPCFLEVEVILLNIPSLNDRYRNYFKYTVIMTALCLLAILSNPIDTKFYLISGGIYVWILLVSEISLSVLWVSYYRKGVFNIPLDEYVSPLISRVLLKFL